MIEKMCCIFPEFIGIYCPFMSYAVGPCVICLLLQQQVVYEGLPVIETRINSTAYTYLQPYNIINQCEQAMAFYTIFINVICSS